MSLEIKINNDLKEAMKAKNEIRLRSIRGIKAAIMTLKTSGANIQIGADDEIKLLQKMVKQRKDSLSIFEQQGREELAKVERDEIEVIESYLPKQLSESEIETIVREAIAATGAASIKDMGKVMSVASKQVAGRAEGAVISGIVKRLLA
ncbi:MAG: GatB/YqeY domain-containing protein [Saprospiraceae bacterium]|nr:GatB/YqeY domain-containing protein [Saprospiraceae bacterium]